MIYMEMHRDTAIHDSQILGLWIALSLRNPSMSPFHIPTSNSEARDRLQTVFVQNVRFQTLLKTKHCRDSETVFVLLWSIWDTIYEELPEVGIWCAWECWQREWQTTIHFHTSTYLLGLRSSEDEWTWVNYFHNFPSISIHVQLVVFVHVCYLSDCCLRPGELWQVCWYAQML